MLVIETENYKITESSSHKDMYIFVNKNTGLFFNLRASETWIREQHHMIEAPKFYTRPMRRGDRKRFWAAKYQR